MMGWDIPGLLAPKRMKQEFKTNWGSLVRMTEKINYIDNIFTCDLNN